MVAICYSKCKEAVARRCSVKKVFLKISQYSLENTCARISFFNNIAVLKSATLLKKRLWHRCFPMNFAKISKNIFFMEHLWWLLLNIFSVWTTKITWRMSVSFIHNLLLYFYHMLIPLSFIRNSFSFNADLDKVIDSVRLQGNTLLLL